MRRVFEVKSLILQKYISDRRAWAVWSSNTGVLRLRVHNSNIVMYSRRIFRRIGAFDRKSGRSKRTSLVSNAAFFDNWGQLHPSNERFVDEFVSGASTTVTLLCRSCYAVTRQLRHYTSYSSYCCRRTADGGPHICSSHCHSGQSGFNPLEQKQNEAVSEPTVGLQEAAGEEVDARRCRGVKHF